VCVCVCVNVCACVRVCVCVRARARVRACERVRARSSGCRVREYVRLNVVLRSRGERPPLQVRCRPPTFSVRRGVFFGRQL
jgi:hypothetical protein